jgi:hypothetical protein
MEDLKKVVLGLGVGYIVSWLYFFLTLPLFIKVLGKARGAFVNYIMSWVVWIIVGYFVGTPKVEEDTLE